MKKLINSIVSIALLISMTGVAVALDVPFEGNEDEWRAYCVTGELTDAQEVKCKEFFRHVTNQSSGLQGQIDEINQAIKTAESNIQEQAKLIAKYEAEIAPLEAEIIRLNDQIVAREAEIVIKNGEIEFQQQEIDALNKKIQDRVSDIQQTMHFNTSFEFLMGAESFEDLVKRAEGIAMIEEYDSDLKGEFSELMEALQIAKRELDYAKALLEEDRAIQEEAKIMIEALKATAEKVMQEFHDEKERLEVEGNQIAGDIEAIRNILRELSEAMDDMPTATGFVRPIAGGRISGGTWAYKSGGLHLGVDYATSRGTTIRAGANGVIVASTDGCGDGQLGTVCGNAQGGTAGGGNQVYMIGSVNGKIYGFRYLHMLIGTPVATGTQVLAGDKIGEIGTSGNSSGPHTHVEVIYLGDGSLSEHVNKWASTGNLSFGCGFGYSALGKLCQDGVGAPCRMRPEELFG